MSTNRPISRQILRMSGAGTDPDPALFCPINGYILNPLTEANGWYKIAEFQTNSPSTTTFDPIIQSSSGEFAWDFGDGNVAIGTESLKHWYADSSTKTVKLYGKGACNIVSIDISADNIIGQLDLRNSAFKNCTYYKFDNNTNLTSVLFPTAVTSSLSTLNVSSCNLTGTLDLRMFTVFLNASILLNNNPLMTDVLFASTITGMCSQLLIYSSGLSGNKDLSMFTNFTTNAAIYLHLNPNLTGVTFASVVTGSISNLLLQACNLTGTLDLRMFSAFSSISILTYNNANLTDILFGSTVTGSIKSLLVYSSSLGYINLLGISAATSFTNCNISIQSNSMTAAEVNHILSNLNTISSSGYTGRVINIGGTNSAPDSSSGGYDGLAAKAALISKGFTVTTN